MYRRDLDSRFASPPSTPFRHTEKETQRTTNTSRPGRVAFLMKIVVSVKQVPVRDSPLRVNGDGKWLEESDFSYEMNEPDAYALEEALQLKEKLGGEVVVVCAGPQRATQTIREALAKGADRAIHVELGSPDLLDALATARLLAAAVKPEAPDFVLTGLQSDDLGFGQTGVVVAELLGYSHATIVMAVEPQGNMVRVKRELEDGWFQNVVLPIPVVLTIQSGINKLRYATLMGIKKAKTKEVKTLQADQLNVSLKPEAAIERVYLPQRSKQTQILAGDPKEVARQLVEKLKFEARVL
jgi:electron transfer flavoprotein beta subunit